MRSLSLTPTVWAGVESLLNSYAHVQADDDVLVAYTPDSRECAAWIDVFLKERRIGCTTVPMAPLEDSGIEERLAAAIASNTTSPKRLVLITLEKTTMSHGGAIRSILRTIGNRPADVYRIINAEPEFFATALKATPDDLGKRNAALLSVFARSDRLFVETPSGTELDIHLDNDRFLWINNSGLGKPGSFVNLPAGEIATYPASVSGVLVADFAVHVNVPFDFDSRLRSCPVALVVDDGRLVNFECDDPMMSRFLAECFERPNADHVGELGFGTNFGVVEALPSNSHVNERRPGVHLGFGQHNQPKSVVGYVCDIHIDLIAAGGNVTPSSGDPLNLEQVQPTSSPIEVDFEIEDVLSLEEDRDRLS